MITSVAYDCKFEDIRASTLALFAPGSIIRKAQAKSLRFTVTVWLIIALCVLGALVAVATLNAPPTDARQSSPSELIAPFVIISVGIFSGMVLTKLASRRYWNALGELCDVTRMIGRCDIALTDEGVLLNHASASSVYKWGGVTNVREDDRYLYILSEPFACTLVPRRALNFRG